MRTGIGEDWILTFSGTAMISVLITAFLMDEPDLEIAALDHALDGGQEEWPVAGEMIAIEPSLAAPVLFADSGEPRVTLPALPHVVLRDYGTSSPAMLTPVARDGEAIALAQAELIEGEAVLPWATDLPSMEMLAVIETQLGLTGGQRAVVQRRLQLAGFDPRGVDGIFGEGTRTALTEMQEAEGLPATGYLDAVTLLALNKTTEPAYQAWRAQRSRARQQSRVRIARAEVPPQRPDAAAPRKSSGCARDGEGRIIGHQSFLCDLSGLGESIVSFDQPAGGASPARLADAGPQKDR
ncbi:MAG: peptidoglycan-binding domain-containing protein [Pseudomonadota bacterium]